MICGSLMAYFNKCLKLKRALNVEVMRLLKSLNVLKEGWSRLVSSPC